MLHFSTKLFSLSLLTLSLAAGCGGNEAAQEAAEETSAQPEVVVTSPADELGHDEEAGVSAQAFDGPCAYACDDQCTTYARCRAPGLPGGLYSWQDKLNIINSNSARVGCVAVIDSTNPAGHVAYVHKVDTAPTPNRIYIHESNWSPGACTARSGSKAGLNIVGFWCP